MEISTVSARYRLHWFVMALQYTDGDGDDAGDGAGA